MNKFLWLLRREVWESRSIWIAPAVCSLIIVVGALVACFGTGTVDINGADLAQLSARLTPEKMSSLAGVALGIIASPFFVAVMFTQFFYTIDALYSERRERSILFWKSLPVSDLATVLSKLAVASVLMPLVAGAATVVTQLAVFIIASAKLSSVSALLPHMWDPSIWGGSLVFIAYALLASALWYLPLVAWALLVSAWAPRSPIMYATLPPLALALAEFVVFRTHYVLATLGERVGTLGFLSHAMVKVGSGNVGIVIDKDSAVSLPPSLLDLIGPAGFFSSPQVWVGVAVAAALIAAAVWMRRYRDASI